MRLGKAVGYPLLGALLALLTYAYATAELPFQRGYRAGQVAYYEPQRGGEWDEYLTLVVRTPAGFERYEEPSFVRRAYPLNYMAPQGKTVRIGYDKWTIGSHSDTRRLVELDVEGRPVIGRWRLIRAALNDRSLSKLSMFPVFFLFVAIIRLWVPRFAERKEPLVGEEQSMVRGIVPHRAKPRDEDSHRTRHSSRSTPRT